MLRNLRKSIIFKLQTINGEIENESAIRQWIY